MSVGAGCVLRRRALAAPPDAERAADTWWSEQSGFDRISGWTLPAPDARGGEAEWTTMRTYSNWANSSDVNWDFALVTLDRPVGNWVGWLGREWWSSDATYNGMNVNTAGYPGDTRGSGHGDSPSGLPSTTR